MVRLRGWLRPPWVYGSQIGIRIVILRCFGISLAIAKMGLLRYCFGITEIIGRATVFRIISEYQKFYMLSAMSSVITEIPKLCAD